MLSALQSRPGARASTPHRCGPVAQLSGTESRATHAVARLTISASVSRLQMSLRVTSMRIGSAQTDEIDVASTCAARSESDDLCVHGRDRSIGSRTLNGQNRDAIGHLPLPMARSCGHNPWRT